MDKRSWTSILVDLRQSMPKGDTDFFGKEVWPLLQTALDAPGTDQNEAEAILDWIPNILSFTSVPVPIRRQITTFLLEKAGDQVTEERTIAFLRAAHDGVVHARSLPGYRDALAGYADLLRTTKLKTKDVAVRGEIDSILRTIDLVLNGPSASMPALPG